MTCIVGLEADGHVLIGGDSAGISGYSITIRADQKVFTRDQYAFGFTSSYRMGQILRYDADLPEPDHNHRDLDAFMVSWFVPAVRKALEEGGYTRTRDGREEGGTFLVGIRGRLYCIDSDFQIGRSTDGYMAVGCGDDLALGSLHSTPHVPPRTRVKQALKAAAYHSAGVSGPFKVVSA